MPEAYFWKYGISFTWKHCHEQQHKQIQFLKEVREQKVQITGMTPPFLHHIQFSIHILFPLCLHLCLALSLSLYIIGTYIFTSLLSPLELWPPRCTLARLFILFLWNTHASNYFQESAICVILTRAVEHKKLKAWETAKGTCCVSSFTKFNNERSMQWQKNDKNQYAALSAG